MASDFDKNEFFDQMKVVGIYFCLGPQGNLAAPLQMSVISLTKVYKYLNKLKPYKLCQMEIRTKPVTNKISVTNKILRRTKQIIDRTKRHKDKIQNHIGENKGLGSGRKFDTPVLRGCRHWRQAG